MHAVTLSPLTQTRHWLGLLLRRHKRIVSQNPRLATTLPTILHQHYYHLDLTAVYFRRLVLARHHLRVSEQWLPYCLCLEGLITLLKLMDPLLNRPEAGFHYDVDARHRLDAGVGLASLNPHRMFAIVQLFDPQTEADRTTISNNGLPS